MKAVVFAVIASLAIAPLYGCGDDDSDARPDAAPASDGPMTDADGPMACEPPVPEPLPPDPEPVDVACPDKVPAATTGICDITAGTGSAILLRGNVLSPTGVVTDGSVLIDGNAIVCVGCDCAAEPAAADATRIDCAGAAISPGLINPHDHETYSEGFPIDHGTTRYDHRHEWRGSLSAPQNPDGTGGDAAGMRWVELRMMFSGVTSAASAGDADGMIRNLDGGLSDAEKDLGFQYVDSDTFPLGDSGEQQNTDCDWNYSYSSIDAEKLDAYLPHVAEGINDRAAEEFRCESTEADNGRDYTESNDAHIHGIGLTAAGYLEMATNHTKLIWSPRSNVSLYGMTADVVTLDRLGGTIALGTDWIYSGSANIQRELACAKNLNDNYYDGYFSDRDLWQMVTLNAAVATGQDDLIGSLEAGKLADIAVFAGPGDYTAAVTATNDKVALVLKGGVPLFGEADVVAALDDGCEAIDVCGSAREVCAAREFGGTTYAQVETAVGARGYPTIFCDTPAGEPSCVPARPGEFTGVATEEDPDGDGIIEGDNCPAVFNPIRPMDDGAQPDADGDGQGDPCDTTPIGDDLDGDGTANTADNCTATANSDQADTDCDGKGDACDVCAMAANPDSVCPLPAPDAVTIQAIQGGDIAEGTRVLVSGAVVTAVSGVHAMIQDPAGGPLSGVTVFVGDAPGVAIGDVVDVTGEVTEYFDETEIENATITATGTHAPLAPAVVTLDEATSEPYEGVLVQITGTVTSAAHDCSGDDPNGDCSDENLWEIGGADGVLVYDRFYDGSDWAAHVGAMDSEVTVTGVMGFRFARRRIMPRAASDF